MSVQDYKEISKQCKGVLETLENTLDKVNEEHAISR